MFEVRSSDTTARCNVHPHSCLADTWSLNDSVSHCTVVPAEEEEVSLISVCVLIFVKRLRYWCVDPRAHTHTHTLTCSHTHTENNQPRALHKNLLICRNKQVPGCFTTAGIHVLNQFYLSLTLLLLLLLMMMMLLLLPLFLLLLILLLL